MLQYQMNPMEVHLEALYLIFKFLWNNIKKRQVMDPSNPMTDESVFHYNSDWLGFYGDMVEEDLPQISEPLGEPVLKSTFVGSDHASDIINVRSHTGILLFVCNGVIKAFAKRQNTVESSTFRS